MWKDVSKVGMFHECQEPPDPDSYGRFSVIECDECHLRLMVGLGPGPLGTPKKQWQPAGVNVDFKRTDNGVTGGIPFDTAKQGNGIREKGIRPTINLKEMEEA
jgi:hypothetical protein